MQDKQVKCLICDGPVQEHLHLSLLLELKPEACNSPVLNRYPVEELQAYILTFNIECWVTESPAETNAEFPVLEQLCMDFLFFFPPEAVCCSVINFSAANRA